MNNQQNPNNNHFQQSFLNNSTSNLSDRLSLLGQGSSNKKEIWVFPELIGSEKILKKFQQAEQKIKGEMARHTAQVIDRFNELKKKSELLSDTILRKKEENKEKRRELDEVNKINSALFLKYKQFSDYKQQLSIQILEKRKESATIFDKNLAALGDKDINARNLHREFCLYTNILKLRIMYFDDYKIVGYIINTYLSTIIPFTCDKRLNDEERAFYFWKQIKKFLDENNENILNQESQENKENNNYLNMNNNTFNNSMVNNNNNIVNYNPIKNQ